MEIIEEKNNIRLRALDSFVPKHIFECGQSFRWNFDGMGYIGVVGDKVMRVVEDGKDIIFEGCNVDDFYDTWIDYFDLDRDYGSIRSKLIEFDSIMKKATVFGYGIRLLNQDPWETLISFILSANNNINRIKKTIENICMIYGDKILWRGQEYYTFPSPTILANSDIDTLRRCGCGYRDRYILETAKKVVENEAKLYSLRMLSYDEAIDFLLKFSGVGPKVADCVALFSLGKYEAFPVDVWIKRIVEALYFEREEICKEDIKRFASNKFGDYAGFAQQYLFYYARENHIGNG
ncbi:MAG TPA: 8-oxoguanine DNA glycosylase [Clostridiales bacterium]|nr:8-oxoguanine DNA glycosylase [Clostridiales bacterium]